MDFNYSSAELNTVLSRIPWSSWTPSYVVQQQAATLITNYAEYIRLGNDVFFQLSVTAGSQHISNYIQFTLPIQPLITSHVCGTGWETVNTGKFVITHGISNWGQARFYDAANMLVLNNRFDINGQYRVAP